MAVHTCACGADTWSTPWPGRPRHCLPCAGLHPDDPCEHRHGRAEGGRVVCADCGRTAIRPARLTCPTCGQAAQYEGKARSEWSCKRCRTRGYIDPGGRLLGGRRTAAEALVNA